jgi:hypothetical protein
MQLNTACGYFAADFQFEDHLSVVRLTRSPKLRAIASTRTSRTKTGRSSATAS